MTERKISLKEAIYLRKSVRNFDAIADLDDTLYGALEEAFGTFTPAISGAQVGMEVLTYEEASDLFTNLTVNAPWYLAFFADTSVDAARVDVGRLGQRCALELCSYGMGTCYLGMLKQKEKDSFALPYVITLAFGLQGAGKPYRANPDEADRRPVSTLIHQGKQRVDDEVILSMLHAARYAPSAVNSQPWRFVPAQGMVHVWRHKSRIPFADRLNDWGNLRRIDIGNAMMNMEIQAQDLGYEAVCAKITPEDGIDMGGNILGCVYEGTVGYNAKS